MSARAIRALRGDNDALLTVNPQTTGDHDDDDDSSVEDIPRKQPRFSSFAMMDSDDDDDEDEDDDDDDDDDSSISEASEQVNGGDKMGRSVPATDPASEGADDRERKAEREESGSEEDLDELIDEFRAQDVKDTKESALCDESSPSSGSLQSSIFGVVLSGLDPRDLDVDASMRNALMGIGDNDDGIASNRPRRGARQILLFGPPRDGWVKPPHYVGGGIGMSTYDQQPDAPQIPWPYNVAKDGDKERIDPYKTSLADPKWWYLFRHSDNYVRDCEDYKVIQQSGDLNALLMFVVHHPYVTEALLQLTTVLYQTNHSQEGLALLRRCLWIHECSALLNFTRVLDGRARMDVDCVENGPFFKALFKLVQVSYIAGLSRTALATSRFLLSLDPLRDPMQVLPAMDHYALACNSHSLDKWLVEMVESNCIHILYRDEDTKKEFRCSVREMPNWAYSYALALFRIFQTTESEDVRVKADAAIEAALSSHPSVVGMLLQKLDVDTSSRSFRRDWVTVLDFVSEWSKQLLREWSSASSELNPIEIGATMQACDTLIKIFVQQNASLWGDDAVLQWVYDNLGKLKISGGSRPPPSVPSPALVRYANCNPTDYEDRIQLLPQDANIINPGMLGYVMEVNPNRPRFLRNIQRGDRMEAGIEDQLLDANGMPVPRQMMFGGPPTQVVDPDWPLVEVFWRSFLPWNRVEGVPPPRR